MKLFVLYVRIGDLRSRISASMSSDRYTTSSYTPQYLANIHEVFCVSTSSGHNVLVCILSHQRKGGHRCGRCCGIRFYRRALDQTRHHVVSFHLQVRVSGLELGGLLGSLIAGRISDWYIATSPGGAVGKRIQVVMAYLIGVAAMLIAFKAVPSGKNPSQTRCFLLI